MSEPTDPPPDHPSPRSEPPPSWPPASEPPPSEPPPASGPRIPEPPAPEPVTLPGWLAEDWPVAGLLAGSGLAAMLALAIVGTALMVLALLVSPIDQSIPWADVAATPGNVLLTFLGGLEERGSPAPFLLTGYVVFGLAVRAVLRRRPPGAAGGSRPRLLALAGKVGVLVAVAGLILGIVLDVVGAEDAALTGSSPLSPSSAYDYDVAATFFLALFASAVVVALVAARTWGAGIRDLVGLGRVPIPAVVQHGLHGARRTLQVALPGVLGLWLLGGVLESWGSADQLGSDTFRVFAYTVLSSLLVVAVLAAVDWSVLLLLGATTFVDRDGVGVLWSFESGVPAWAWASLLVVAAALVHGGRRAAIGAAPRTQLEAARAASLVGPAVALACLPVAIGWVGQGGPLADVTTVAVLVPSVWGLVAVLAAWLYAVQEQLPSGVAVAQDGPPPPDEPPA